MSISRFLPALLAAFIWGCDPSKTSTPGEETSESGSTTSTADGKSGEEKSGDQKPFMLGDLIEPFEPPTLAELEGKVEWVDNPTVDSMALLRDELAKQPIPSTSQEALQLKNDSPESNAKILGALGRPPADDSQVDWDQVLTRHLSSDIASTNPLLAHSAYEGYVLGAIGFGLFGFDWRLQPFGAQETIESWQTSKDRLYDKIVMRKDLTWSDGKPITAHDIVFSFKVILSSQVPVPAQRQGTDQLKWVEAYDDHTLVFFHKAALATNVTNLSFSIIPKHIYENSIANDPTLQNSSYHVKIENDPISGGGYELTRRVAGSEVLVTRRESWYMYEGKQVRDKPYFRQIRFKIIRDESVALLALKSGDLDEQLLNAEQWRTQTDEDDFYKNNTKAYGVEWVYFYFGWNMKTPFFEDKRVRQAMSYAYDHDELLSSLRYGLDQACVGIFHETSPWFPSEDPPKPYKQDLGKAETLLDEAGWIDSDGDGIRDNTVNGRKIDFEFSMLVTSRRDRVAICSLLKENLGQIGVVCNVRPVEFTVIMDRAQKREYQAMFAGWGTGTDPSTSENLWMTGEDRNYPQYSNPEVDRLFIAGRKEFDREKRAEMYQRIHKIIYDDQPYTWLYFRNSYYGFNKSLRGYKFSPRGPFSYSPGSESLWKPTAVQ